MMINCTVVIDSELTKLKNLCAGANEKNYHIKNVNYGRDYKGDIIADIKTLKANDPCPKCGAPVKHARGIEVGQVFKLGTKYSDSMGAVYKDENQKDKPIVQIQLRHTPQLPFKSQHRTQVSIGKSISAAHQEEVNRITCSCKNCGKWQIAHPKQRRYTVCKTQIGEQMQEQHHQNGNAFEHCRLFFRHKYNIYSHAIITQTQAYSRTHKAASNNSRHSFNP